MSSHSAPLPPSPKHLIRFPLLPYMHGEPFQRQRTYILGRCLWPCCSHFYPLTTGYRLLEGSYDCFAQSRRMGHNCYHVSLFLSLDESLITVIPPRHGRDNKLHRHMVPRRRCSICFIHQTR